MSNTEGPFRVGRSVGRTIYRQVGDEASKQDELVGVMDTRELAARAVACMNALAGWDISLDGVIITPLRMKP